MDSVIVQDIMKDRTQMAPAKTAMSPAALLVKLSIVSHLHNVSAVRILWPIFTMILATVLLDCI